jgi:hypothetical protein
MRIISQVISIIAHPIFIGLYSYIIFFKMDTFYNKMLFIAAPNIYWLLFVFLIMMVGFFPFLTLFIMHRNKIISAYSIPNRKQRLPVLIFITIYYSMTYYIFRHWNETLLNLLNSYVSFLFGTLLLLLLLFLITLRWKISLHSTAIAGLCGGIMSELMVINEVNNIQTIMLINSGLLILIGVVCFSRLYLKAHTFLQILSGVALGFSLMFIVVYFQLKI